MNAVSSRSHSVFTLYITGRHEASGQRLQGALNLVDLAGRSAISLHVPVHVLSCGHYLALRCICDSALLRQEQHATSLPERLIPAWFLRFPANDNRCCCNASCCQLELSWHS